MIEPRVVHQLDELAQELDMLVYRLERAPPEDIAGLLAERARLRRELETLRDALTDLLRDL